MNNRFSCIILGVTGLAQAVHAQGLVEFQVSPPSAESWSSSLSVLPGSQVDVRVRITYNGTAAPIGLGDMFFQPTISNWIASGPTADTLLPFVNVGGALTTPSGQVPDAPGVYGRISPFGDRAVDFAHRYIGHNNTVGGTSYLRIAQATATNWVGGAGNTSGGAGVVVGQVPFSIVPTNNYPPFDHSLTDVVVLKFSVDIGADTSPRTLSIDAAEDGLPPNTNTLLKWYGSTSEVFLGSVQGPATFQIGTINVIPSPASIAPIAFVLAALPRRHRRLN